MTDPVAPLRALGLYSLRRPRAVLVAAGVAIAALGAQTRDLRFEAGTALLAENDPVRVAEAERRSVFGEGFRVLVALYRSEEDGGVVEQAPRLALRELHRAVERLPGVRTVASLVNAPTLVASAAAPAGTRLWPADASETAADWLRALDASELGRRMLLSPRRSLAPIYVELDRGADESALVEALYRVAEKIETKHPSAGTVLIVGAAVVENTLASHVLQDLARLVPVTVIVLLAGLLLVLRRLATLVVIGAHCLALVAVVLGGMALAGIPIDLVTVLIPVILLPVGVADLLHLAVRLESGVDARDAESDPRGRLERALSHLYRPMAATSVTTAIGFLGFVIAPIPVMRVFGLTMSAGAIVALFLTVTVDAAALALLWRPADSAASSNSDGILERWLAAQTRSPAAIRYHARTALVVCGLLAVAGGLSLSELSIEDTWIRNFGDDARPRRDTLRFEGEFLGTNLLVLQVEADSRVPGARASALEMVNRVTTSLTSVPGIRGVLSSTSLARALDPDQGRPWESRPTPSPVEMARALEDWERRGLALPRASAVADPALERFQVHVFVLDQDLPELEQRVGEVAARAAELQTVGVRYRLGGDLVANIRMVRVAVWGQAQSLALVLGAILALALILTRSPIDALLLISPMLLAILLTYLVLIVAGIPYGIAVSMFPPLVVGLAIDFALHLRAGLLRCRGAGREAWCREMAVVVRGILLNGALWAAGFAVLTVSALPPNRSLGLLCAVVVAFSTLLTLLQLPAAILVMNRARPARGPREARRP